MRYLHLINDSLFTNFSINLFEECNPGNNVFLVGVKGKELTLKHTSPSPNVFVKQIKTTFYRKFLKEHSFDVLVVHCLHDFKCLEINKIKKKLKIVWLAWGTDIKYTKFYKKNIYYPFTKELLDSFSLATVQFIKLQVRDIYFFLKYGLSLRENYRMAVKKIDFCATVVPEEFDILYSDLPYFRAKQVFFSYASIEYSFKHLNRDSDRIQGYSILIGNSADPSSNHVDVFYELKRMDVKNRNIVVPLNYGEDLKYRDKIIHIGKNVFGESFKPLVNQVLSETSYISLLKECSVAIMLHEQQQALGNLITLIWLGCKVFMSENSVVYSFFIKNGIKVFSFQNEFTQKNISSLLDEKDISLNRLNLYKIYSHESVLNRVKALISIVEEDMQT